MVRVGRSHQVYLSTVEFQCKLCACVSPAVCLIYKGRTCLFRPCSLGKCKACPIGCICIFDIYYIHSCRSCRCQFKSFGRLENTDLADHRNFVICRTDCDPDLVCCDCACADQSLRADRLTLIKNRPFAASVAVFYFIIIDALSVLDRFLDRNYIEFLCRTKVDQETSFICPIVCRPVCIILAVHCHARSERGVLSAYIGCFNFCCLCHRKVFIKCLLDVVAKLCQTFKDRIVYGSLIIRRDVQQERRIMSYGAEIHIPQRLKGFRSCLGCSPEPSRCDARVRLWHSPLISILKSKGMSTC